MAGFEPSKWLRIIQNAIAAIIRDIKGSIEKGDVR